jgi:hypothetical protein
MGVMMIVAVLGEAVVLVAIKVVLGALVDTEGMVDEEKRVSIYTEES